MNTRDYLSRLRRINEGLRAADPNCINPAKGFTQFLQSAPDAAGGGSLPTPPATRSDDRESLTTSHWWLLHFTDRDSIELSSSPAINLSDVLAYYPGAVAAEPFTPIIRQPSAPLTASEEATIRAWLALIGETDPGTISGVIEQCQRNEDARGYFTGRAVAELPNPTPCTDDRRTCKQCANLSAGACNAAKNGELFGSKNYQPESTRPRRCEAYQPGPDDPDRRHGGERWPGLIEKEGA